MKYIYLSLCFKDSNNLIDMYLSYLEVFTITLEVSYST